MKYLFAILSLFIFTTAQSQNCHELPSLFTSQQIALYKVKRSNFSFKESIDTSKSSWISGLSFYSCDKKTGFLIMETKSQKYIHQEVPVLLWEKLKKSSSFGTFYNNNIRGKYKIRL
jgi:hypothetical protein